MEVAKTKGVGFLNVREFVLGRWGETGWTAVLGRLREHDRQELGSALAVGWYPLELYARLIRAVDDAHGKGNLGLMVELGRFEAERDLTTIHRLFLRFFHPSFIVEKTGTYWQRFHDSGVWEVTRPDRASICGVLRDWGCVDEALCRELVGYIGRSVELAGAQRVSVDHARCRARGEGECRFLVRFAERA